MFKSVLLIILLGLITPLLNTKVADNGSNKDLKPLFVTKGDQNHNAEEVLDFWDFNPTAVTKNKLAKKPATANSAKTIKKETRLPFMAQAVNTVNEYTGKNLKQVDQVLEEMERLLGSKKLSVGRILKSSSRILDGEETLDNQEETVNPGTGNNGGETGTGNNGTDTGSNTGNTGNNNTSSNGGSTSTKPVSQGMGTITMSGMVRYDADFDKFLQDNGKQIFIETLSKVLDVDQSSIKIVSITRGSVIINFELANTANDTSVTSAAVDNMKYLSRQLETAIESGAMNVLGAGILNYKTNVLAYDPVVSEVPWKGKYYVMGVALLVAILMTLGLAWLFYKNRRSNMPQIFGRQNDYKQPNGFDAPEGMDLEEGRQYKDDDSVRIYAASPHPNYVREGADSAPVRKSFSAESRASKGIMKPKSAQKTKMN